MRRISVAYTIYAIMLFVAFTLAFILPSTRFSSFIFSVPVSNSAIANITFIARSAIEWFAAAFAFTELFEYAKSLDKGRERVALRRIAAGIGVLALGISVPVLALRIVGLITLHNPNLGNLGAVLARYIGLALSLAGFIVLSFGIQKLVRIRPGIHPANPLIFLYVVISTLFTYFVVYNYPGAQHGPYYLPLYLLLPTVVMLSLYTWFIGFSAASMLFLYARAVKGILYKQALRWLANGVVVFIVCSILSQFVAGLVSYTHGLSLAITIIAVYILFLIQTVSFVLMAYGARQLKKIEEV